MAPVNPPPVGGQTGPVPGVTVRTGAIVRPFHETRPGRALARSHTRLDGVLRYAGEPARLAGREPAEGGGLDGGPKHPAPTSPLPL